MLSRTQKKAVAHLRATAGRLQRWPGGYWTTEQIPMNLTGAFPAWWVGTRTVAALERAGIIRPVIVRAQWWRQHFELAPTCSEAGAARANSFSGKGANGDKACYAG